MIVVMQLGATEAQIQAVAEAIRAKGLEPVFKNWQNIFR